MASALCVNCGAEFHWEARRGMRLAQVVSPCCGARGAGFRYDRRRAGFLTIERLGSLEPAESWTWHAITTTVYLLRNGNVQLGNGAIYAPVYRSGDRICFRYAGRTPRMDGYRLRLRDADYRALSTMEAVA